MRKQGNMTHHLLIGKFISLSTLNDAIQYKHISISFTEMIQLIYEQDWVIDIIPECVHGPQQEY